MEIVVIGGGASGMAAALEAARYGGQVTLVEKENRVGKKLLATGNGRCNYANRFVEPSRFHGQCREIIHEVLQAVPVDEVLTFFQLLGVTPKEESDGKIIPYSEQGSNVLDLLRYELEQAGVKTLVDWKVTSLRHHQKDWLIHSEKGESLTAHRVILATGGRAGSQFGADDSGYRLAESLGHHITPLWPALVQLRLEADWLKALKGVKWQGAASVVEQGIVLRREAGELLITDYGISGPPILQLSRQAHTSANDDASSPKELRIHLLPEWDSETIMDELMNRFHINPDKPADLCLLGLFHKRLVPTLLKAAGIWPPHLPAQQVSATAIKKLAEVCRSWSVPITGTLSWQQAQVTAGGVDTREIHPVTMASTKAPNCYITGELMDVDGDCGGFNLYWAWATGLLAGRNAAMG
ncbi:aminoacetone oxidase family FAD-binding enzyme [Anoxynatronum buryatiense]|uniref:NAD(P)/FAD-dependent oxidoreductase n=1 Tax=Anoxynatronum buryatiense TaxID=489973 RepID=A0AA46AJS2_9CLOT|nr:aminoacetone oxidase family FAD-binding enzyme [Anoxynatronum buryatiense]SMP62828.1 hypothetical protein SAMN06296020_110106 [Anoxynatronum buryatiense]